ncbi:hypothetical protein [Rhizobium leguminosarum]
MSKQVVKETVKDVGNSRRKVENALERKA